MDLGKYLSGKNGQDRIEWLGSVSSSDAEIGGILCTHKISCKYSSQKLQCHIGSSNVAWRKR